MVSIGKKILGPFITLVCVWLLVHSYSQQWPLIWRSIQRGSAGDLALSEVAFIAAYVLLSFRWRVASSMAGITFSPLRSVYLTLKGTFVAILGGAMPSDEALAVAFLFDTCLLVTSAIGGLVFWLRNPLGLQLNPRISTLLDQPFAVRGGPVPERPERTA